MAFTPTRSRKGFRFFFNFGLLNFDFLDNFLWNLTFLAGVLKELEFVEDNRAGLAALRIDLVVPPDVPEQISFGRSRIILAEQTPPVLAARS